ncbi:MAG: hypothetical protein CLLPBCKN_003837 [Chroococcidiopsis cubana SAG 39.79]|nr:hypothetical protein [Chroococcidiopsis cubana SAG 39.79]
MDNAPILDATTILVVDDDKLHAAAHAPSDGTGWISGRRGAEWRTGNSGLHSVSSQSRIARCRYARDGWVCLLSALCVVFLMAIAMPILIVTRLDDAESLQLAFDAGATDFITKPINDIVLRQRSTAFITS